MIRYDCPQGGTEWLALHAARPTASNFDRILTPKTRKPSAASEKYLIELCTGWLLGQPPDAATTGYMDRGKALEDEAIRYYECAREVDIERVGFVTTDDGRIGGSPDFLVGTEGGGEIKCLSAVNHVGALLGAVDDSYNLQVQGYMFIGGWQWWDRVWFNPAIQPLIVRVERDQDTITQLALALEDFLARFEAMKDKLLAVGCKPVAARGPEVPLAAPQTVEDALGHPPEQPAPSKHERAADLAARFRALPIIQNKQEIELDFMLSDGEALERSIESLPDKMLDELNVAISMEEKGL